MASDWGEVVTRQPYRKVRLDHLLSKESAVQRYTDKVQKELYRRQTYFLSAAYMIRSVLLSTQCTTVHIALLCKVHYDARCESTKTSSQFFIHCLILRDRGVFPCVGSQLRRLERTPDKREVGGSSPPKPTKKEDRRQKISRQNTVDSRQQIKK